MKKIIAVALLLVFVGGFIGISVAHAVEEDLPCWNLYQSCKKSDATLEECLDLWENCMLTLY